jgi:ABC-type glycerol-3-phosphate transport system substrate-binding protein
VNTSSTLIQAALAGKGPHAALLLAKEEPVNLAMRGGLEDLSKYGLDDIYDQFYESAWIPFRYMNGIYALPETQTFEMMFYRTDVFKELGISAPNTWDEFYTIMEKIQNANLSIGILEKNSANLAVSSAISMFDRFLFQNSGTYFNDNWSTTLFDEEVALNAFEKTVKLYTDYGLDQQFDFYNRFRSGEMVLSIQPYSMYNLLTQAAPEITGLWKMVPIPGTKTADGKINRAESSAGNGCVMLKSAVEDGMDKIVFDFLKWWVSGETQGQYSVEIESTMGAVARNTPANKLAFDKIAWSEDEKASIKQQWEQVTDVRQIPGNYVIVRSLTSALRLTISSDGTARKNLQRYNKDINSEITRKRLEFNLN